MNRYETYQDSGIPWLGEVPAHWETIQFRRVVKNIKDGTHGTHTRENSNFPLLSAKNVFNDGLHISDNESCISEDDFRLITSNGFPKKDDLLITCVGSIGRSCVYPFDEPMAFQRSVAFLRLNEKALPKYYKYFVESAFYQEQLKANVKLSIQSGVYLGTLIGLSVCLPPLPEQTAIADYLDNKLGEIDALISKQETLLEKLAEQRTAIITYAVTKGLNAHAPMKNSGVAWLGDVPEHWEVIKNKFILEFSKGLTITKENLLDEGVPCVNYGEIHSKYGFEVNPKKHILKCVSEEYLKTAQNALLENGDFVFADTSEDIKGSGNFTYLSDDTPIFAGYHTIIAKPNRNKIFPRFLAYVFESGGHRNQIREVVKGVKVFSITQAFLKNTFVWLPPLPEQTAIANYLDDQTAKIDRLSDTVNQTIASLKEYRSALITQAVTGKIKAI